MKGAGVYKITLNGRIYVGSAVCLSNRWKSHRHELSRGKHHSRFLQSAYDKHGISEAAFEVLEAVEDTSKLIEREQAWLDRLRPFDGGYNTCRVAGSRLGVPATAETKAKQSKAHKGKIFSAETRKKLAEASRGHAVSDEMRAKISAANRKRGPLSKEQREKISAAHRGKPKSPAHRANLSKAGRGVAFSDERRARISAAQFGRKRGPHSAEHRRKLSEAHKRFWLLRREGGQL